MRLQPFVRAFVPVGLALVLAAPGLGQVPSAIPDAMVGIWKGVDVPAEFHHAATGAGIAVSGWYGQLKLRADGRYEAEEYREGELGGCRVSTLRRTSGQASTSGTTLTLTPASNLESTKNGCDPSKNSMNQPVPAKPERFAVQLEWTQSLSFWEVLTLKLRSLDRDGETYVLHLVQSWAAPQFKPYRLPAASRTDPIPAELADLWVLPAGAKTDFYDPSSSTWTPPSEEARWLRFLPDGHYELTAYAQDLVPGPGCKKGAMLHERGTVALSVGANHQEFINNFTLRPEMATLIEQVGDCGSDNGQRKVSLMLQPRLYFWSLGRTPDGSEVLEIRCSGNLRERDEWQFLVCRSFTELRALYSRKR